jgi:hypothetical protein
MIYDKSYISWSYFTEEGRAHTYKVYLKWQYFLFPVIICSTHSFQNAYFFIYLLDSANILNKQLRTNDKGWSSILGVGRGANNPSP